MFFKKEKKKATAEKPVHCNELAKFSIWMKCPLKVILSAIKKKKKVLPFPLAERRVPPLILVLRHFPCPLEPYLLPQSNGRLSLVKSMCWTRGWWELGLPNRKVTPLVTKLGQNRTPEGSL